MNSGKGTLLVAHPQSRVAKAFARTLAASGFQISRRVSTINELFDAVVADDPDIILLDSSMGGASYSTVRRLVSDHSAVVAVLGDPSSNPSQHLAAFRAGARGYLSLEELPNALTHSLELLLDGALVVSAGPWQASHSESDTLDTIGPAMAPSEATAETESTLIHTDTSAGVGDLLDTSVSTPSVTEERILSVLVGHSHHLSSGGIASMLTQAGYEILGECDTAEGLLKAAGECRPDIILVEAHLFENQLELVRTLTDLGKHVVVALSDSVQNDRSSIDAFVSGASGCLSTDDTPASFLASLQLLMSGAIVMSPSISRQLHQRVDTLPEKALHEQLSERERELVILIGHGASNKEIGDRLSISPHTVKAHLANILSKMGLRNRQQIAAYAARSGMLVGASETNPTA